MLQQLLRTYILEGAIKETRGLDATTLYISWEIYKQINFI